MEEYKYIELTRSLIEELISHELSRATEYLLQMIDGYISKYNLLDTAKYTNPEIHLRIMDGYCANNKQTPRFDKVYSISSAKAQIAIDIVSKFSSIVKSIEDYGLWGITFDIYSYKPDGTRNYIVGDVPVNPSAWQSEFDEMKGWICIYENLGKIKVRSNY